jgi:hypothetical protein
MSDDLLDQWHRAVATELEARVKSRLFFVHVGIDAALAGDGPATSPAEVGPKTWETLAEGVEQWLAGLDPDATDGDNPPTYEARPGDTPIELSATPKKLNRRGTDPLIVNPYPAVNSFGGTYSTGPPPQFDDGT